MADGRPNLNGIWAASNTANWDIQTHQARQGPVIALGAAFSVPAGMGVVEGNEIPYKPGATAQRVETDADGDAYEVHMTKADGSIVTVKLDSSFKVTQTVDGMA